jgi:hypothetical protein
VHQQTGKLPAQFDLSDLDAPTIGGFLHDLETVRGNSAATRNTRLAAIHSLFRYASLRAPEHANLISRRADAPRCAGRCPSRQWRWQGGVSGNLTRLNAW